MIAHQTFCVNRIQKKSDYTSFDVRFKKLFLRFKMSLRYAKTFFEVVSSLKR
ncbi:hypothetical protein LBBP_00701 [Leptospira borgpetersenii serovar Ballum]|uniref:Uncharacterized protein n=1 Tax=Leptospira borgpetersenii serovar Ballum TaxID=280505 RepID=A0A0S2INI0_LEPBO|nr:hypothetical protein LBBP_00701 [Leptospira borgpetersenii serovar Ballum]